MFSILHRYFARELTLTLIAVSAILLVVIVSKSFISLLTKVMDGKLPADIVFTMLSFGILKSAILLAPFAVLVAVMLTLGRLYRDSEIYAIKASGIGGLGLVKYTSLLVLPLIAMLFYLTIFITPWISWQIEEIKLKAREQTDIYGLVAGQFIESKRGDWVIFFENEDKQFGMVRGIFIHDQQQGKISIETAHNAWQKNLPELGGESLVLSHGQRYEDILGEDGVTVSSFRQHSIRIPELDISIDRNDPEFTSTKNLIKSSRPADQAELQWRLSIPIAAILLALLAFPLSVSKPRQGQFTKLGLAIVIYLVYANLLILAKSWIAEGKLPVMPGLFICHIGLIVVIAYLAFRQRRAA